MAISVMVAIKRFMERDSKREAVSSRELIEFKKACSEAEWQEFGTAAAAQLDPPEVIA